MGSLRRQELGLRFGTEPGARARHLMRRFALRGIGAVPLVRGRHSLLGHRRLDLLSRQRGQIPHASVAGCLDAERRPRPVGRGRAMGYWAVERIASRTVTCSGEKFSRR